MKNADERKSRYLMDSLPVRMGGLAANLARVGSVVAFPKGKIVVIDLFEESKFFIEWTAADFDVETAAELVDVQRKLVRWQRSIDTFWDDEARRMEFGAEAKYISDRLLAKSGLLNQ